MPQQAVAAHLEQDAGSVAALAKQMQALMRQGPMQEMQALAQQMAGYQRHGVALGHNIQTTQQKDQWAMWLGVLKQVEAHAYRTAIAIDKDPGVWPLTNDCGR